MNFTERLSTLGYILPYELPLLFYISLFFEKLYKYVLKIKSLSLVFFTHTTVVFSLDINFLSNNKQVLRSKVKLIPKKTEFLA
jgi:hypothetical protein